MYRLMTFLKKYVSCLTQEKLVLKRDNLVISAGIYNTSKIF